jgi:hypothetical protein
VRRTLTVILLPCAAALASVLGAPDVPPAKEDIKLLIAFSPVFPR